MEWKDMTFDQKIWHIAKCLVWVVGLVIIAIPMQIIWFLVYFFIKGWIKKRYPGSLVNLWSPMEMYAKFGRKFLGKDNY